MSDAPKAAMGGNRRQSAATANTPAAIWRLLPSLLLPPIAHPPDFATVVVTHEKRSVRKHQETDRPPPAGAVGTLPTDDEIIYAHRAAPAAVHLDAYDLCARRHGAIPRAVQCDERVAAILSGELGARVERESERRRMRLHRDRRGLDVRAVSRSVLGIGLAGEIALGPAVVAAVFDDVDVLRGKVIAQVVAVVVAAPQLTGGGIERDTDRVAQPFGEYAAARTIPIELRHGGAQRVALVAEVAGRTHGHVHLAVGSEDDRARRMAAARKLCQCDRRDAIRIEPLHILLFGHIHRVAAKGDAEWSPQPARDRHHAVDDAVVIRVSQLDDPS